MGDPGRLTIPCESENATKMNVLSDSGAKINFIPFSFYQKFNLPKIKTTRMTIHMGDQSIAHPQGIVEELLVKVRNFVFR